jgi:pimeloyl-ACP methyl ester carboxylesterase
VLGVNANHWFGAWATTPLIAGEAKDIAKDLPAEAWQRLSAGRGTKGERFYDWAYCPLADLDAEEFDAPTAGLRTRGLLIRRSVTDGECAYFTTWCPHGTSIDTLVRVEGTRWRIEEYRTHNRRPRGPEMVRSITTRDKPGTTDPRVADAMVKSEMQFGDSVPTGTYLDMTAHLPLVDPSKVEAPVLLIRGQYDGISTEADLIDFFTKLPNQDREYSVVPGAAHSIIVSVNRAIL